LLWLDATQKSIFQDPPALQEPFLFSLRLFFHNNAHDQKKDLKMKNKFKVLHPSYITKDTLWNKFVS